jgi:peptidoglycan/LPS O-acetylase OafA/YrhL
LEKRIFTKYYWQKPLRNIIAVIVIAFTLVISYQARELAAAFLIFSVLFVTIGAALLLLALVEKVALEGIERIETRLAHVRARHVTSPLTRGIPRPTLDRIKL